MKNLIVALPMIAPLPAVQANDLFPFVLPWDDGAPGPTQLQLGIEKPAGESGFVRAENGHFYVGEPARRLRLFGVNLSFDANFPDKEQADKVAARLAKFGINSVRFHHMDAHPAPRGIFLEDRTSLDPAQLERFDYLFSALKKQGIYGNINLKVSRTYPEFQDVQGLPRMHKGVDLFNRVMIDQQKKYARELLSHVNPHTGLSYVNDPAVALVEINNENGLLDNWWKKQFDNLPEPFASELQGLWNAWLIKEYGTLAAAERALAAEVAPPGRTLAAFEPSSKALKVWKLESNKAEPDFVRVKEEEKILQIRVENDIQGNDEAAEYSDFVSPEFSLEAGKIYTIELTARSTPNRSLIVAVNDTTGPRFEVNTFSVELQADWSTTQVSFKWDRPNTSHAALSIGDLEKKTGLVDVTAFSLREGGRSGDPLLVTNGSAGILRKADYTKYTGQAMTAWMKFLWDTESGYWREMRDFLRNEVGVRCPIIGTQLGAYSAFPLQQEMDALDIHVYWKHPEYPDPKDRNAWTVGPESMMEDSGGGTIPAMALRRMEGKPWLCTEYNHVTPNLYSAEGFILGAAYAAFQDMDGLYVYSYSHAPERFASGKLPSLFDIDQHPLKMATLPIAASLFLRGDVRPAKTEKRIEITKESAIDVAISKGTRVDGFVFGASPMDPLRQRTSIRLTEDKANAAPMAIPDEILGTAPIVSDTWELRWTPMQGKKSVFTADTPRTKCVVGFSDGKTARLGMWTFAPSGNWNGWSVLALSSETEKSLEETGGALLVACGRAENTDWEWKGRNSLRSWGKAPSLTNGIKGKVQWKSAENRRLAVWALDEKGQRHKQVPVSWRAGGVQEFGIGPEYGTIWYELEMR